MGNKDHLTDLVKRLSAHWLAGKYLLEEGINITNESAFPAWFTSENKWRDELCHPDRDDAIAPREERAFLWFFHGKAPKKHEDVAVSEDHRKALDFHDFRLVELQRLIERYKTQMSPPIPELGPAIDTSDEGEQDKSPPESMLKKMKDNGAKPKTQEKYIRWWKAAQKIRGNESINRKVLARNVASLVDEKWETVLRTLDRYFPGWSG